MTIVREVNVLIYRLISNEAIEQLAPLLTINQRVHLQGISRHKTQMNYAASRVLLNRAMSKFLGVAPSCVEIQRSLTGKPFVSLPDKSQWHFNYSHTEGACALVIAKHVEVGVDVESSARKNNYIEIAKNYFHSSEYKKLLSVSPQTRQKACFYKLWTLKEAYLKAFGTGLADSLDSFSLNIEDTNSGLSLRGSSSFINTFCYGGYVELPAPYVCSFIIQSGKRVNTKLRIYSLASANSTLQEEHSLKAELVLIDLQ